MKQFIYDMIHMTDGEKLINYWWLWVFITACYFVIYFLCALYKPPKVDLENFCKRVSGGDKK